MSKIFNYVSAMSCIIAIILLYSFIAISDNFYFNGYIFLIFLLMLMNPIANLCRLNKKNISNPIFHVLILTLTGYISYISINSIIIYNNNLNGTSDNSFALNMSQQYFGDKFIYVLATTFVLLFITLLFKKNKIKSNKDNSKIMLLIILVTSLVPILVGSIWRMGLIFAGFDIALLIFSVMIFFKFNSINIASELQRYYFILIICSISSINPIAFILSIYMYLQLDTFGLHI